MAIFSLKPEKQVLLKS